MGDLPRAETLLLPHSLHCTHTPSCCQHNLAFRTALSKFFQCVAHALDFINDVLVWFFNQEWVPGCIDCL